MPSASAENTIIASQTGCVNAKPSEAPMNGAVQGVATSVASRPDIADPA